MGRLAGDDFTEDLWHLVSTHLPPNTNAPSQSHASFTSDGEGSWETTLEARFSTAAQSGLVRRSLEYLQQRFKMHVQSRIFDNLKEHSIGELGLLFLNS